MTDLPLPQLADTVRATQGAYHKLTIIAGPSGEGKTRLLSQLAAELQLPCIGSSRF
jgi:ABC-type lipoprotein export system ATPase subunit